MRERCGCGRNPFIGRQRRRLGRPLLFPIPLVLGTSMVQFLVWNGQRLFKPLLEGLEFRVGFVDIACVLVVVWPA